MRKTKIIATLGPASETEEMLEKLCLAGANVIRLNFSHGSREQQRERMELIKKVREKLNLPIAVMLDTKGPECRIKTFRNGKIELLSGDTFTFTSKDIIGDATRVSVTHKSLPQDTKIGDRILVNNGLVIFEVTDKTETDVICKTLSGGVLSNQKSMSFPGRLLSGPYLSEEDKKDILLGIDLGVDFIAASFVSRGEDIRELNRFLKSNGGENIEVIAKIENRAGVENIDEICNECSGIMVARGDLGVEIPFHEVPSIQKQLITECRMLGKRVITATEMLESMIVNPRPTRAEVSDVANAVFDGSSAIMLSGETAAGNYPEESVKTMSEIAEFAEKSTDYSNKFYHTDFNIRNTLDAVSHTACSLGAAMNSKCTVVCSISGITARMVSRFRPSTDILGLTTDEKVWRRLALSWGVTPILSDKFSAEDEMIEYALKKAEEIFSLQKGDSVVITLGKMDGHSGNTDTVKIKTI